jgi:uncharacterized membrane protein YoaK (UPF0700 family)
MADRPDVPDADARPSPDQQHQPRSSSHPDERARLATLVVLAGVGGYIDAVSYLGLGHVFTAAMTGNTVLLALAVAEQDWGAVLRSAVALIGFVGGVALGQIVVGRFEARVRWPRAVGAGLSIELALLVALTTGSYLAGSPPSGWTRHLLIGLSALAMGTQSATARKLDVGAVSTTYVTGTLTSLTAGTVEWLRSSRQARRQVQHNPKETAQAVTVHGPVLPAIAWAVYAGGALVGGLIVLMVAQAAFPLAALFIASVAFVDWRVARG